MVIGQEVSFRVDANEKAVRPASYLWPVPFSFVIIARMWKDCCPAILEFIHEKVRNSSWWWGYSFSDLFIFHCLCVSFVDYRSFRLKSKYFVLALVTSPEANTHVEVWDGGWFFWRKKNNQRCSFGLQSSSVSVKLFLSLINISSLLKRDFKIFIWLVVGHWQNNWLVKAAVMTNDFFPLCDCFHFLWIYSCLRCCVPVVWKIAGLHCKSSQSFQVSRSLFCESLKKTAGALLIPRSAR